MHGVFSFDLTRSTVYAHRQETDYMRRPYNMECSRKKLFDFNIRNYRFIAITTAPHNEWITMIR